MKNNQTFGKAKFEELIDLRDELLPPTWVASRNSTQESAEPGKKVHASGRDGVVRDLIIGLLDRAREQAIVASFLLAEGAVEDAMLNAANRGVRVYVLLASEARLVEKENEGEFDARVRKLHEAMLHRLGGLVLFRSAPHFHAKLVLIDPADHPAGVLLTANLTTEALERNEELAVELTPEEVREAEEIVKWAMWESAEHELLDAERFRPVKPLGKVSHPEAGTSVTATTSATQSIRDRLLQLLERATSRIVVSSFGWQVDHTVVQKLCERARDGIEVTVLARVRPAAMPTLVELARAGAFVYGYKWLHAKAIWTDTGEAIVMSANLEADGLDSGFELGVRLDGDRAREVEERLKWWREAAPWRLVCEPKLGAVNGDAKTWKEGQLIDITVSEEMECDLGTVVASSAEHLAAPRPADPANGVQSQMAHQRKYTWTVRAPSLAPGSKEERRPSQEGKQKVSYSPPVFRDPKGRRVVVVRSPDELPDAVALKKEIGAAAVILQDPVISS